MYGCDSACRVAVDPKFLENTEETVWIQEVEGNKRPLYGEELHSSYPSLNIIGGIKIKDG